jgi:hypothetical protein
VLVIATVAVAANSPVKVLIERTNFHKLSAAILFRLLFKSNKTSSLPSRDEAGMK